MLNSFFSSRRKDSAYGESAAMDLYLFLTRELCRTDFIELRRLKKPADWLYLTGRMEKSTYRCLSALAKKSPLQLKCTDPSGTAIFEPAFGRGLSESMDPGAVERFHPIEDLGCFILEKLRQDRLCRTVLPAGAELLKENAICHKTRYPKWLDDLHGPSVSEAFYASEHLLVKKEGPFGRSELTLRKLTLEEEPDEFYPGLSDESVLNLCRGAEGTHRTGNEAAGLFYWKSPFLSDDQAWFCLDLASGNVTKTEIDCFLDTDAKGFDYAVCGGTIEKILGPDQKETIALYDPTSKYLAQGSGLLQIRGLDGEHCSCILYHDAAGSKEASAQDSAAALYRCLLQMEDEFYLELLPELTATDLMKLEALRMMPEPFTSRTLSDQLTRRWELMSRYNEEFRRLQQVLLEAVQDHLPKDQELSGAALNEDLYNMLHWLHFIEKDVLSSPEGIDPPSIPVRNRPLFPLREHRTALRYPMDLPEDDDMPSLDLLNWLQDQNLAGGPDDEDL